MERSKRKKLYAKSLFFVSFFFSFVFSRSSFIILLVCPSSHMHIFALFFSFFHIRYSPFNSAALLMHSRFFSFLHITIFFFIPVYVQAGLLVKFCYLYSIFCMRITVVVLFFASFALYRLCLFVNLNNKKYILKIKNIRGTKNGKERQKKTVEKNKKNPLNLKY